MAVDGVRVPLDPELRYFVMNKPRGVVTTLRDPHARRTVAELLPDVPGLVPVGRLDRDTEGLLILTNDGELANRLTHPSFGIEKEYLAEVREAVSRRHLAQLVGGVDLEDGPARAASARVEAVSGGRTALRIVMLEGRKREVRRMLEVLGLSISRLVRVRQGPLRVERLAPGAVRELDRVEVTELFRACGM